MKHPSKREDVLLKTIVALEHGHVRFTFHAQARMKERDVLLSDVEEAIYNGRREENKDEFDLKTGDWKYVLRGLNDDRNKDIRIIIVFINSNTLILTVIDLNR